jgi:hypothetical protein
MWPRGAGVCAAATPTVSSSSAAAGSPEPLHSFFERNRRAAATEVLAELHRRQVLEHEVPLPALGRIRRLQPAPRRDGALERLRREQVVARHGGEVARDRRADGVAVRERHVAPEHQRELGQDDPVFTGFTGRRDHPRRGLYVAGGVGVGGVLLDEGRRRQQDVGDIDERRVQHAMHDERLNAALLLRVDDPVGLADRAIGTGIEHVEHLHLTGGHGIAQRLRRRDARLADVEADRAPRTFGASTGGI